MPSQATLSRPPAKEEVATPSFSPWQDYLVSAYMGDEKHEPYKGTSAHQSFNNGQAQVRALPDTATEDECAQRLRDLEWLYNSPGYRIEEAEFMRVKRGTVIVEGTP